MSQPALVSVKSTTPAPNKIENRQRMALGEQLYRQ